MAKEKAETFQAEAEQAFREGAGPAAAPANLWEDGSPKTREQIQSEREGQKLVRPEAALTPEATGLPAASIQDVMRYLPALVQIIAELKQFGSMKPGDSQDYGPLTTWLPTGGDYEITLHVTRKK